MRLRVALLFLLPGLFVGDCSWGGATSEFAPLEVRAGVPLRFRLSLPAGYKVNPEAPSVLQLRAADGTTVGRWDTQALERLALDLGRLEQAKEPSGGHATLEGRIFYCEKRDARVCITRNFRQRIEALPSAAQTEVLWHLEPPTALSSGPFQRPSSVR